MALEKVTYVDRETKISAQNLNDIQDAIIELEENDTAKGEQISDLEQATTATTIGPAAIATFDASVADMPLKGLTVDIEPVQDGEGNPSPENVRPIKGWTGCNVTRTGKNLWKSSYTQIDNGVTLTVDSDGGCSLTGAPTAQARFIENVSIPAGTYYLSANNSEAISTGVRLLLVSDKGGATIQMYLGSANKGMVVTLPVEYSQIRITVHVGAALTNTKFYPQLELGSTATAYEPYQGDTYNVAFPSPDPGTVYGGTLMINVEGTGELTVNYGFKQITGETIISVSSTSVGQAAIIPSNVFSDAVSDPTTDGICNVYQLVRGATTSGIRIRNTAASYIYDQRFTDLETAKSILNTTPVQVVYRLANPVVYQLTAEQITTLLGTNNIWADCGNVTVTYGAYLETVKAHAERLGDSILSAIAPLEASYTASRAYTVGV